MAGLFDGLANGLFSDDPRQAAYLALASGLLSGKGNFGQVLGQATMDANETYQKLRQSKQAEQLRKMQLEDMERQRQLATLPKQFMVPPVKPETMDNRDVGQPGEPQIPASQFDMSGYINALMGVDPVAALNLQAATKKQAPQPIKLGKDDRLLAPDTFKEIVSAAPDKPEKDPEEIRVLKMIYGEGTPAYQQALSRLGSKKTTHSPAANITNYGSPVPVQLPGGGTGYVQPSNKGGPASPLVSAGGKPFKKPVDGTQSQDAKQAAGALARLNSSMAILNRTEKSNPSALMPGLPQELARNVTEMGANIMTGADRQKVESAQLDALDAALWLATGAAYNKEQLRGLSKAYFPQVGDKEGVAAEKKAKLQVVINAAKVRAGQLAMDADQIPQGIDPKMWSHMTPEEQALWKP